MLGNTCDRPEVRIKSEHTKADISFCSVRTLLDCKELPFEESSDVWNSNSFLKCVITLSSPLNTSS